MTANIGRPTDSTTDVLIIGAGLAGLSTALSLPSSLRVIVLSKDTLEACSSFYAQGGIAACLDDQDKVGDHVNDTLIAGAGLCDTDKTAQILANGKAAVAWLCAQGVPFTPSMPRYNAQKHAPLHINELHLTQEGGHSCRRIAHAEDATGQHIMQTLIAQAQAATNITILPFHEALDLLTTPDNNSNNSHKRCIGAQVFDQQSEQVSTIHSRAVVIASGGVGKLFKRASTPDVCTGDGVMMAWQAGCRLANLEFVQFHPTGLAVGDSAFLISEALRGEGAYLRCPITNERFMLDVDSRGELAPRDIVARAIAEQITQNGKGYVHLDISHKSADFITMHFPKIYQTVLDLGIDITRDPIPVAPTAHYSCGGIATTTEGLSDVTGLYAAGEAAYTGLHGANRLASNSLLECIVMGRNIAAHLPNYVHDNQWTPPVLNKGITITIPNNTVVNNTAPSAPNANVINKNTDFAAIQQNIKTLMSRHLGIVRDAARLEHAMEQLEHWYHTITTTLPDPSLNDMTFSYHALDGSILTAYRLKRQLQLAMLIGQSAYQRCESLGGHYRSDYPNATKKAVISVVLPVNQKANKSLNNAKITHQSLPIAG